MPIFWLITCQRASEPGTDDAPGHARTRSQPAFVPNSLRRICFLISHRHMRGFPASGVPLKSSQRVCFCQALACFRDYIFVPFHSPSSRLPCSPQRNSRSTSWHTRVRAHGEPTLNMFSLPPSFFSESKWRPRFSLASSEYVRLFALQFLRHFQPSAGLVLARLIRSWENIVVRVVTRRQPKETIRDLIDVYQTITARVSHFRLNKPLRLFPCLWTECSRHCWFIFQYSLLDWEAAHPT